MVFGRSYDRRPVGATPGAADNARMPCERLDQLARRGIPDARGLVFRGGNDPSAVSAERSVDHGRNMTREPKDFATRGRLPNLRRPLIVAQRDKLGAVRAED